VTGSRPTLTSGRLGILVLDPPGDPRRGPGRAWTATSVEIRAPEPLPGGIDGEAVELDPPLELVIRPAALRVRISSRHPGMSPSGLIHYLWAEFEPLSASDNSARKKIYKRVRRLFSEAECTTGKGEPVPYQNLWASATVRGLRPQFWAAYEALFLPEHRQDEQLLLVKQHVILTTQSPLPLWADVLKHTVAILAVELRYQWDLARNTGSQKHQAYDARLQGEPLLKGSLEAPMGFYRAKDALAADYDVLDTEFTMFDKEKQAKGQTDLLLRHRRTGKIIVGDFKNCVGLHAPGDRKYEKKRPTMGMGQHPLTENMEDSKYNHYRFQMSYYWKMLDLHYYPGGQMDTKAVLINIDPLHPTEFRLFWMEVMNVDLLWDSMPWDPKDPHQSLFPGPTLMSRIPDTDPRCRGRTKKVPWPSGAEELAPQMVWVERKYVNKKPKCAASPFAHPWRWYRVPPPWSAAGYYERHLLSSADLLRKVPKLVGKELVCWCRAEGPRCHADVLAKYANLYENGAWSPDKIPALQEPLLRTGRLLTEKEAEEADLDF